MHKPGSNPFGGSGTSAPRAQGLTARTKSENPLITALSAGSRLGKHFAATGKFELTDQAGEDQDRATIMHRLDDFVNPDHRHVEQNALQRKIAPVMEPVEQGAAGFGIDTALDPTTYIPFGKVAQGIGKAAHAVSDLKSYLQDGQRVPDLIRYEHNSKVSPRGAKFYTPHTPENPSAIEDRYETRPGSIVGGTKRVEAISRSKRPYNSGYGPDEGTPVWDYLSKNLPPAFTEHLFGYQDSAFVNPNIREDFSRALLNHVGLSKKESDKVIDYATKSAERNPQAYGHVVMDRTAVELAKKNGHDALKSFDEFLAADPKSVRLPPQGNRKKAENLVLQALNLPDKLPQPVKDAAGVVGAVGNKIGDAFHWGGDARRELSPEQYRDAGLASNRQGARESELARRLELRRSGIFDHLTDEQRLAAYRLINGEVDVVASPAVNKAVAEGRKLLKDSGYIQADASGRARLAAGTGKAGNARFAKPAVADPSDFESMVPEDLASTAGKPNLKLKASNLSGAYQLPDDLKEFAAPDAQGVLGARNIRENYLPAARFGQKIDEASGKVRPREFNLLNPFAGHALERESFEIGKDLPEGKTAADVVGPYDDAMKRYMKSSATQATAGMLRDELGVLPGQAQDALEKLFKVQPRAKGDARFFKETLQDRLKLPADAARSTLTAFGLKHGLVNVPTLAGLSEGARPVGAMFRDAGRLMKMTPEQKWEFNRDAREAGVLGPEYDRDNQTLGLLDKIPTALRAAGGGAYGAYQGQKTEDQANPSGGLLPRVGAGVLGGVLGGVGGAAAPAIGRASNDLTWNLDEAAKRAVFNAKVRRGMTPAAAAAETLKDTVDYTHRTPIAKGLQDWGLAPFATFATKVPGAVAGSVARDPRKAILMDRLSQGLLSNGKIDLPGLPPNDKGEPASFNMSTPLSETLELGSDPTKYARAKMSDPARAGASIAANTLSGHPLDAFFAPHSKASYMTFGQPLLPHKGQNGIKAGYLLNSAAGDIPLGGGRAVLDALDADEFSPESLSSMILGPLVGGYVK